MTNNADTMGVVKSDCTTVDVHELLDRQIIEYRKLVGYHRLEKTITEGRVVPWPEAACEVSASLAGHSGHEAAA